MFRKISLAMMLTAVLARGLFATPSEPAVRVERTGAARVSAPAGSIATAAFRIINRDKNLAHVQLAVSLPVDWTLISGASNVDVRPGSTELELLTFAIPRSAKPGLYVVRYTAEQSGDDRNSALDSALIEVRAHAALDVQFLSAPTLVRGGTSFTVTFMIRNYGNTTLRLALSAQADGGLTARPDYTHVVVEPENVFQVIVRVIAPRRVANEIHTRVKLIAADQEQGVSFNALSTMVRVLPTADQRQPRADRLPLQFHTRVNSMTRTRPSWELSGSGAAMAGSDLRFDLMARTATRQNGLFEDRDRYSLHLGNANFDVRLGDQLATLTPLTESGRTGFGGSFDLRAGPIILGGLAIRDRRGDDGDSYGGRVGLKLGSIASVTGNYLVRGAVNAGPIMSVRTTLTPSRAANVDIELARNASGEKANAAALTLRGSSPWFSYDLRSMRRSVLYNGPNPGSTSDAAVVRLRPVRSLEVGASYMRSDQGNQPGFMFSYAGQSELKRVFASIGRVATVEAEQRDWTMGGAALLTETVRVRSAIKLGALSFYPGLENSTSRSALSTTATRNLRYTLRTLLRLGEQSISVSVGANTADRPEETWQSNAVSIELQPTRSTHLTFEAQQDRYSTFWRSSLITASIDQRLPRDHHIALHLRQTVFNGQKLYDQSPITFEYVVPLGVPMPGASLARVSGIITDARTGRPVRDALVTLDDQSTATGANGRFSFNSVSLQTHYLQVDLAGAGTNLTTLGANPIVLDLADGGSREIRIGVTKAARVHGSLMVSSGNSADSARIAAFKRASIVQLSQGSDIQRRTVDASGHFSFDGLRPGRWTVRIVSELPTDYALADATASDLELQPDADRELVLRVVRKQRPMEMQQEKDLPLVIPTRPSAVRSPQLR